MTEQEAYGQAFMNGRAQGYSEGYARGLKESIEEGEWTYPEGRGDAVCSACGLKWCDTCQECGLRPSNTNYCPGCGKKMRRPEQ